MLLNTHHILFAHIISNKKLLKVQCEHAYFKIMPTEAQRLRKVSRAKEPACGTVDRTLLMTAFLWGHGCPC